MLARTSPVEQPAGAEVEVAILVDYDGTIASIDVTDELVRLSSSEDAWLELELRYRDGHIGSRALLEAETQLLPPGRAAISGVATSHGHDPTFEPFVRYARRRGMPIEVVSDGLGFFIRPALASAGLGELPVFTASIDFRVDRAEITFPAGHPRCRTCGTCKRDRVLIHQRQGRHVVFIGDGFSDQYAVRYADTVFAKGELAGICRTRGVPFHPWVDFGDVQSWLERARPVLSPPEPKPFTCGPEAAAGGRAP